MLVGCHLPNRPIELEDICRFRIGQFEAAKLMPYHNQSDVTRLRALGCGYFLVRLPDSVDDGGRWKKDTEWAEECVQTIRKFSAVGVKDYQLDNEPNLTWRPLDTKETVRDWRWLNEQVIGLIRQSPLVPKDTRLGLAPLAWKPDTWKPVQEVWIPEQRKLLPLVDFVCVHSYWQYGKYFNHPPFGGNATHWHDVLLGDSKPIVITEWGSSCHELAGVGPKEAEQLRTAQYPAWLNWVKTLPYVESAFLFILSGTSDWRGFEPTDRVLKVL